MLKVGLAFIALSVVGSPARQSVAATPSVLDQLSGKVCVGAFSMPNGGFGGAAYTFNKEGNTVVAHRYRLIGANGYDLGGKGPAAFRASLSDKSASSTLKLWTDMGQDPVQARTSPDWPYHVTSHQMKHEIDIAVTSSGIKTHNDTSGESPGSRPTDGTLTCDGGK